VIFEGLLPRKLAAALSLSFGLKNKKQLTSVADVHRFTQQATDASAKVSSPKTVIFPLIHFHAIETRAKSLRPFECGLFRGGSDEILLILTLE
jgi:hypothetical protein